MDDDDIVQEPAPFQAGDRVYVAPAKKKATVIRQLRHYDMGESFWDDLELQYDDGVKGRSHCWQVKNKRIQEMAEEAAEYADYYAMLSETGEKEIFTERFAELIILECAKIVATAVEHCEPASTYVSKILELKNESRI